MYANTPTTEEVQDNRQRYIMVSDEYFTLVEGLKVQLGALSSRGSSFVQIKCILVKRVAHLTFGLEVHYSRLG